MTALAFLFAAVALLVFGFIRSRDPLCPARSRRFHAHLVQQLNEDRNRIPLNRSQGLVR